MGEGEQQKSFWQKFVAWLINAPGKETALSTAGAETPTVPMEADIPVDDVSAPALLAWSSVEQITNLPASATVEAAVDPEGRVHLVWEQEDTLYHSFWTDGDLSVPIPVAMGKAPSLAVSPGGSLHLVFSHVFEGRQEIFHTSWQDDYWTLPRDVSHTDGISSMPTIVVSNDNRPQVAWSDTSSGDDFPRIYHAELVDGFWVSAPVPNSRGAQPSVAVDALNRLHVVWQDKIPTTGENDIFHIQRQGGQWSVAENVSDTPNGDSVAPRVACAEEEGHTYILWEEFAQNHHVISFVHGQFARWSWAEVISDDRASASQPRVAATTRGCLHTVWMASGGLFYRARGIGLNAHWGRQEQIAVAKDLVCLALTADANGRVHLIWAEKAPDNTAIYYRQREALLKARAFTSSVF